MSEEEKNKESGEVSRRQFLTGAGLVVGGAAIGAGVAWPLAPKEEVEVEKIVEVEKEVSVEKIIEVIKEVDVPVDVVREVIREVPVEVIKEVAAEIGLVSFVVNGKPRYVKVEPNWSLAYVLREKLNLTGTKIACAEGGCGFCTVNMDGRPVLSCLTLAVEADGKDILTIEGLATGKTLHPIQQAFIDHDGLQCGACTSGQIMSANVLLNEIASPTAAEVREALAGNICRCGAHPNIIKAVLAAAK